MPREKSRGRVFGICQLKNFYSKTAQHIRPSTKKSDPYIKKLLPDFFGHIPDSVEEDGGRGRGGERDFLLDRFTKQRESF